MTRWQSPSGALVAAVATALLTASIAGAGIPEKSGGSRPVRLTLLSVDDNLGGVPAVQHFIDRVRELSGGAVTINFRFQNDGTGLAEQRAVRDVRSNEAQLTYVGTRVWDTLGVNSFVALHAPMLIDSYPLEAAVLRTGLPRKMLAGVNGKGIVGLALLGDNLRYVAAARKPVRGPADFRGLRFRATTSRTQAMAMRALGAIPSTQGWATLGDALGTGRLDALEVDLNTYQQNGYAGVAPFMTLNLALWPRTTVLIANATTLDGLSEEQRGWIERAADEASAFSLTTFGEDQQIVPAECRNGMKAVFASPAELRALRRAFKPVYATLRRNVTTARAIDAILALKKGVEARPLTVPKACRVDAPASAASGAAAAFPEGVYRFRREREDLLRVWPNVDETMARALLGTFTVTFRDGALDVRLSGGGIPGCRRISGAYAVQGRILTVTLRNDYGCALTGLPRPPLKLRWASEGSSLRFRVVGSATPLDRFPWETNEFLRIG